MSLAASFARVAAALAVITVSGFAVSRPFTSALTRREKAAWGFASGLLVQTLGFVFLVALGVAPRAPALLLFHGFAAALALGLTRRARASSLPDAVSTPRGSRALVTVLVALAAVAWLVFLVGAAADSMWATDFLAIWGYKGKIAFLSSGIPRRLFEDPALYYTNRSYPLLVPLSLAALAGFAGEWNDQALALLYPMCALATLLAISGFLQRRVSRLAAAAATALSAFCFFLYSPANAGTADIPLALGLVLACTAAGDASREMRPAAAARLSIAAFVCAGAKQEGTLFVLLLAAALIWSLRRSGGHARFAAAMALLAPAVIHGFALRLLVGRQAHREFDFTLLEPSRWPELAHRSGLVAARIGGTEARQALLPILALAVYFLATRKGIGDWLIPVFVGQFFVYAVAFAVSAFGPAYAIDAAFGRLTMSLFPAFTLILGARLPTAFRDSAGEPRTPLHPVSETAGS
jgi:hypothetical protein